MLCGMGMCEHVQRNHLLWQFLHVQTIRQFYVRVSQGKDKRPPWSPPPPPAGIRRQNSSHRTFQLGPRVHGTPCFSLLSLFPISNMTGAFLFAFTSHLQYISISVCSAQFFSFCFIRSLRKNILFLIWRQRQPKERKKYTAGCKNFDK